MIPAPQALLVSVGCLNVDILANIANLPESDSRIMTRGFSKALGGMATNVACAAAGFDAQSLRVELIAALGQDAESHWVSAELIDKGVHCDWLDRHTNPSSCLCIILIEPNGDRVIISEPKGLDYQIVAQRLDDTKLPSTRHLHVDGFHAANVFEIFAKAREMGWSTSVDIDELADDYLALERFRGMLAIFDVVFVNRNYVNLLFPNQTVNDWCDHLTQLASATETIFLLTLGAQGVVLITPDQPFIEIPALAVNSIDTTGAGDVFAGVFLNTWLTGSDAITAAHSANIAAALSTTAMGAQGYLPTAMVVSAYKEKSLTPPQNQ